MDVRIAQIVWTRRFIDRPLGVVIPFVFLCSLVWVCHTANEPKTADKNFWTAPRPRSLARWCQRLERKHRQNENSAEQGIDSAVVKLLKIYAMQKSSATCNVIPDYQVY